MELDCDNATPLHYAARYKQRVFGDLGQSLLDYGGEKKEEDGGNEEKAETEAGEKETEDKDDPEKENGKIPYRKNSGNLLDDSKLSQAAAEVGSGEIKDKEVTITFKSLHIWVSVFGGMKCIFFNGI